MSKDLYRLSDEEISNFGNIYLHNNYKNFEFTIKKIQEVDTEKSIIEKMSKNMIDWNLGRIQMLRETAENLLKEYNKNQVEKKDLQKFLLAIQKVYDDSLKGGLLYSTNKIKEVLIETKNMDPKKIKNVESKLDELETVVINYYRDATNFIIKQRDTQLSFQKTKETLDLLTSVKGKHKNFETYFKKRISAIRKTKNPLKNAIRLVNSMSENLFSTMGYSYEEILADSFIDDFLEKLLPNLKETKKQLRVTDWFHNEATADIGIIWGKKIQIGYSAGFSVKHYDHDVQKNYKVPTELKILLTGSKEEKINFYSYIKNNVFFLFKDLQKTNAFSFIKTFEEEITRFRMLVRFFDGIYEVAEHNAFHYETTTDTTVTQDIIPAVFWLSQSKIYWTHEILEYFLNSEYNIEKTATLKKKEKFKRASTEGLSIRLIERGTNKGTTSQRKTLQEKKAEISKEERNYKTISTKIKELSQEYIGKMRTNLSFYSEARINFKLTQIGRLLKKGGKK